MPRADPKDGHEAQEVGAAIIAAWLKSLPALPSETVPRIQTLSTELKTALENILSKTVDVVFDDDLGGNAINVVVPRVPDNITTQGQLLNYLRAFHDAGQGRHYHEELGLAVLFGCR